LFETIAQSVYISSRSIFDFLKLLLICRSVDVFFTSSSRFIDIIQLLVRPENLALMTNRFRDRAEAGYLLAQQLLSYAQHPRAIVLGLPRGGVPVADPIAQTLQLPLDICLVHKLGVPGDPEVAMGAIDLQGRRYLNAWIVTALQIPPASIDRVADIELRELQRRDRVYRGDRPAVDLHERIVILVDDGLATGATMRAAIAAISQQQPAQIVIAVPVAARNTVDELGELVDRVVCLMMPQPFYAIGSWYENFDQTTDAQVCEALSDSFN
jgi:putative phosphoribosyl transferase